MEKKTFKVKSRLSNREFILAVDEKLNKLKGAVFCPQKMEEANRALKKLGNKLP